ncbi:unnamed protein product [Hyaloperonospora brassicae]|uniref:Myb-like domain-containing protein n=1 Tax=Hyaloperonospora brassicae TaxID=162125 RepID=A0AAV0TE48_HYABA|nr:unnamed protein product [Hyaloperonospora brassicae]
MATQLSADDGMETEAKRRLGPHVQRRGDGFTEAESMGMLQLVRSHWREGWDVVAQLHNQQFSKHNRSADSLKKKFSRLYRSNVPLRGAKNYQAIAFAHVVHKEMVEGVAPAPDAAAAAVSSVPDEQTEQSESAFQPPQDHERLQDGGGTEPEKIWTDTPLETPLQQRLAPTAVFAADAHPLPSDDLLTSVLKVILRSQYQRDLDREEERIRRAEERQRRREEAEQRRQEEEQRRDEEREERRRRSEERAEERDENRRRHEQFMQMMMLLVSKKDADEQRNNEC